METTYEIFQTEDKLQLIRDFFNTGETRGYLFRMEQLQKLKNAIQTYEDQIFEALYNDLKKNKEEAYATETGLVIAEISYAQKRLRKWMKPRKAKTNFLNFPSAGRIYHEPLGVTLIIGSWNYPFQLLIAPLVGAIAAGNCAVLKPSEVAPATSAVISKMIKENFTRDYITVFEGEGSKVVPELMHSFRFDHIFYTGSTGVGRIIYEAAAKKLIPVTLELGGKSPAVVEEDADITVTAKRIILGKFLNAGQTCVAPDYVLLQNKIKDQLINELKKTIEGFWGPDIMSSPDYGKIINQKRFETLLDYLNTKGKIEFGGKYDRDKLFFEPTIITGISEDDALMNEEIFGPILPVINFDKREEALEIIQRNSKPLSFYLFARNKKYIEWWMDHTSFGGGCVNNTIWHLSNPNLPFGGIGGSGIGAYHGKKSFEAFSHDKSVMTTPLWFDPKLKYPPFKGKLNLFKRFIK